MVKSVFGSFKQKDFLLLHVSGGERSGVRWRRALRWNGFCRMFIFYYNARLKSKAQDIIKHLWERKRGLHVLSVVVGSKYLN